MKKKTPGKIRKTGTRRQKRCDKTRDRILAAARSVFTERGLAATTVDEITERADVGRGSFYYHFDSKSNLIRHLVEGILDDLITRMKAECEGEKSLEGLLNGMIGAHIAFFSGRWEDFVLYYQGRADLTLDDSYECMEAPFLLYINSIERLVESAVHQEISKPKLRRLACAIAGFLAGYYSFASVSSVGDDVDKEFMSLRSAFVTSLGRFAREALPDSQVRW